MSGVIPPFFYTPSWRGQGQFYLYLFFSMWLFPYFSKVVIKLHALCLTTLVIAHCARVVTVTNIDNNEERKRKRPLAMYYSSVKYET
jgi:hypothetical protein